MSRRKKGRMKQSRKMKLLLVGAAALAVAVVLVAHYQKQKRPETFSAAKGRKGHTHTVLQRTAFVAFTTPNYKALTDVWRSSLLAAGVPQRNIYLTEKQIPAAFKQEVSGEAKFRTDVWYWCLRQKLRCVIGKLRQLGATSQYEFLAVSDCDIQFFPGREGAWEETVGSFGKDSSKGVMFLGENTSDEVNGGFYVVKKKYAPRMAAYLAWVLRELERPNAKAQNPLGDQTVINKNRHLLKYTRFPSKNVVWGTRVPPQTSHVLFHHAVAAKHNGKLDQMKEVREKVMRLSRHT